MKNTSRRNVAVLAAFALGLGGVALSAQSASATVPDLGQHIAVPAYIPPSDTTSWSSLNSSTSQLGFIVVNVSNGPGSAVDSSWKTVIDAAHAHGTKVLGYVDSGYFGASSPARATVLGDTDATSWTVQAQQDVNRWYSFYGSSIDGIFVDDGMNTCGPTTGSNAYANLYINLNNYIHANHAGSLTVVNPGISVPQCYEDAADVIVSFEGDATTYLSPPTGVGPLPWQLNADPDKFWNIIYNVSSAQLTSVMNQSKSDNAGYVYATADTLPNPYDTAPTGSYWTSEQTASQGTSTTVPSTPAQPYAISVYTTGADLGWTSASSSSVAGYEVYRNGLHVASVGNFTPNDTTYTPVGLTASTSYSYTIRARSLAGVLSAASSAKTITTDVEWGTAASAPGSLASSNLTANGVQLSWTASTVTNDAVAFYDVYENGTRILSLQPTVTSVHLGYLSPGTTYSFYVIARVTSDTPSAASSTVSVTTPTPTPITNALVTFTATNAHFEAQYNLSYTFQNVFIDTDGSTSTGYQIGGIGADYLIENGTLYRSTSGANAWDWTPITLSSGPLTSSSGGLYKWDVPSSTFPSATTTLTVVFDGSGSSTEATLAPITAAKS
ncbi:fibronectin type III domain-containing protein [Lysinimonas soli]|uniref:Fibronectin type III domain-containing protein n=1 Tax=Lysinimonas soli TaxID=1074233 RepID=A0ABW0NNE5_9MICO